MNSRARFAIGLGIPFLAVIPTIPVLSRLPTEIFGMPISVIWLFACMPLTSICLAICWFAHDRHQTEDPSGSE